MCDLFALITDHGLSFYVAYLLENDEIAINVFVSMISILIEYENRMCYRSYFSASPSVFTDGPMSALLYVSGKLKKQEIPL